MVAGSKSKLRARYVKPPLLRPDGAIGSLGGLTWRGTPTFTDEDI